MGGAYQGSEHLEVISDAEKQAKDKAAGLDVTEKILGMAKEGVIRLPSGKEFLLPEDKKQELRTELVRFVDEGIKKFDADSQTGLDEAEWTKLHNEIYQVAERFLAEAHKAEIEKRVREIESLTLNDLIQNKEKISAFLRANPTYLNQSGEWYKINAAIGNLLGTRGADSWSRATAKQFGQKIQSLIREKTKSFSDSDGRLGPESMNVLALAVGAPERMKFVMRREEHTAKYDVAEIMARAKKGATAEKLEAEEAAQAAPQAPSQPALEEVSKEGLPVAPDVAMTREAKPGFARLMEPSEQYETLSQFSRKQKIEMVAALAEQGGEQLTPAQQLRIQQIGIIKQILESIKSDIKDSRTWGEWFHQAAFETGETTESRQRAMAAMSQELDVIAKTVSKNPNATLGESLQSHFDELFADYKIPNTILKDPTSFQELQGQYITLLQFLRNRKDYETARGLVEGTLLGEQFEKARKELDGSMAQKMRDKAYEKINKMVTAETLVQWREGGMADEQIEEYKKALIEDAANNLMNEHIREVNNGRPFQLGGKDAEIAEIYRDMTGAGDWNIADEKWDFIIEELIVNAPLIIVSGGAASLARAGISAGARAVIASGRLARLGLAVASGGEKIIATGRLGRTLYRAGRAGGLIFEGAAFETVHSLLKGDMSLFKDLPTFAKRALMSAATLGAFKFSGKIGKSVGDKLAKITPLIKDHAVARVLTHFVVHKNFEVATMLAMSAAQQGLYNGNLEDWDWGEEVFHALVTSGALTVAGTATKPVIEVAGRKFFPAKSKDRAVEPGEKAEIKTEDQGGKLREKFAGALKAKLESIRSGISAISEQIGKMKPTLPNLKKLTEGLKRLSDAFNIISPKNLASKALNAWYAVNEFIGQTLDALGPKLATIGGAGEGLRITFREMYQDFQTRRQEVAREKEARREEVRKERERMKEEAVKEKANVPYDVVAEIATNRLDNPKIVEGQNGKIAFGTDEGVNYKPTNEDAVVVDTAKNGFASIDGIGGEGSGDIAARIFAQETAVGFREGVSFVTIQDRAYRRMIGETVDGRQGINIGRGGVCYAAARVENGRLKGAKAGDVKIIIIGKDGQVRFETVDENDPYRPNVVTNYVAGVNRGTTVEFDVPLKKGDRVIAASDGLFDNFTPQEVAEMVRGKPIHEAIKTLNDMAKDKMQNDAEYRRQGHAAKPDNINVIVYDIETLASRNRSAARENVSEQAAKEKAAEKSPEPRQKFEVGNEVYITRTNGVVEKGWFIKGVQPDGTYNLERKGTGQTKRGQPPEQIWSIDAIERAKDARDSLGSDAAEFERRKFLKLQKETTLDKSDFDKLFGGWEEIKQQNVGDCYLIAALNSLRVSPHFEAIMRTSVKKISGGWEVRIPLGDPKGRIITVKPADLQPQANPFYKELDRRGEIDQRATLVPVDAPEGFQILEAAFVKSIMVSGEVSRYLLDQGGLGHRAIEVLLGSAFRKVKIDSIQGRHRRQIKPGDSYMEYGQSTLFAEAVPEVKADLFDYFDNFHPSKDIGTAGTLPATKGGSSSFSIEGVDYNFDYSHAYSIVKVIKPSVAPDGVGKVYVADPHDTSRVAELTYDQFTDVFSYVSSAEINYNNLFSSS